MNYKLIRNEGDIPTFEKDKPIFCDTESLKGLYSQPRLWQCYQEDGEVYIFDLMYLPLKDVKNLLKPHHLIWYNASYDLSCKSMDRFKSKSMDDLFIAAKIAFPKEDKFTFGDVLKYCGVEYQHEKKQMQRTDWSMPEFSSEQLSYAADDVKLMLPVYEAIKHVFNTHVYSLDMEVLEYALEFQRRGMQVDHLERWVAGGDTASELQELQKDIKINVNSVDEVKSLLGTSSAKKEALIKRSFEVNDERIPKILRMKKLNTQLSNLGKYTEERVKGFFVTSGAKTGRFTCKGAEIIPGTTNIQNITREFKTMFVAKEGYTLIDCDYAQIEIRLAAALWGESNMIRMIKDGLDIHTETAKFIYKKENVSKEERQLAKSANFGLLYGMTARGFKAYLMENLYINLPLNEVTSLRNAWLDLYPGFRDKQFNTQQQINQYKYYDGETVMGRKYRVEGINQALNIQVQGTGAEVLKQALVILKNIKAPIVNVVHDSVILEVPAGDAKEWAYKLESAMLEAWDIIASYLPTYVPMEAEPEITQKWGA